MAEIQLLHWTTAIEHAKRGFIVRRMGWKSGAYMRAAPPDDDAPAGTPFLLKHVPDQDAQPWSPSIPDLTLDDWHIVDLSLASREGGPEPSE